MRISSWSADVFSSDLDAHAKNLALICDQDGHRQLAPCYDMVPTFVMPESLIYRRPALRVGEAECIDRITADDLRAFAREAGYAPRFTLERVGKIANALLEHLQAVGDALAKRGVDENRLRRATDAIAHNASRKRKS